MIGLASGNQNDLGHAPRRSHSDTASFSEVTQISGGCCPDRGFVVRANNAKPALAARLANRARAFVIPEVKSISPGLMNVCPKLSGGNCQPGEKRWWKVLLEMPRRIMALSGLGGEVGSG